MEVSQIIKSCRLKKEFKQDYIAMKLGYTYRTISQWECGEQTPNIEAIYSLSEIFEIDPISFFTGEIKEGKVDKEFNATQFAESLNSIIKSRNIPDNTLINIFACSKPTLKKILNGQSILSINQFKNVAKFLDINYYDLYFYTGIENPEPLCKKEISVETQEKITEDALIDTIQAKKNSNRDKNLRNFILILSIISVTIVIALIFELCINTSKNKINNTISIQTDNIDTLISNSNSIEKDTSILGIPEEINIENILLTPNSITITNGNKKQEYAIYKKESNNIVLSSDWKVTDNNNLVIFSSLDNSYEYLVKTKYIGQNLTTEGVSLTLGYREDKPEIEIDYTNRTLTNFLFGETYTINDEIFTNIESVEIKNSWYNIKLSIIHCKRDDEEYIDSLAQNLYVTIDNYTNTKPLLDDNNNLINSTYSIKSIKEKYNFYLNSILNKNETLTENKKLTDEKIDYLLNSLNKTIPYYDEINFTKSFQTSNIANQSYSYSGPSVDQSGKQYISITGVSNKSIEKVYIPKEINGIRDIRVESNAFTLDKNPNLKEIVFQEKPHVLGNNCFTDLDLDILDFGVEDNYSYYMYVQSDENGYYSALADVKHIEKLRLPLTIASNSSLIQSQSQINTINISALFTRDTKLVEKSKITSLFIAKPVKDENALDIVNSLVLDLHGLDCNCYNALYVPTGFNKIKNYIEGNLSIRMVRFQKSLSSSSYLNAYGYFTCCYALEYLLYDDMDNSSIINLSYETKDDNYGFIYGCFNFKGYIEYERLQVLHSYAFSYARMTKEITLRNLMQIDSYSFYCPLEVEVINIYHNEKNTCENPLIIPKNTFINANSYNFTNGYSGIKKINFYNFYIDSENSSLSTLILATNYKSENIEVNIY